MGNKKKKKKRIDDNILPACGFTDTTFATDKNPF